MDNRLFNVVLGMIVVGLLSAGCQLVSIAVHTSQRAVLNDGEGDELSLLRGASTDVDEDTIELDLKGLK